MIAQRIILELLILIACLCLISCCHQNGTSESTALKATIAAESEVSLTQLQKSGSSSKKSAHPIIGHPKTRDKLITIRTEPDGPLYTVKSSSGQVLAVDLPAAKLTAKFPELKDIIEHGIANWAGLNYRYQKTSNSIHFK